MAIKKIIYSANLQDYRPVIWYGVPVYDRYVQLRDLLTQGLGTQYSDFLSEPLIKNGKANWLSSYISNGTEFTKLNTERQEFIRVKLQQILNKIKAFANELKDSADPHQKELGELLELAIEVPSFDNVIVEDDKIVLTAWGFSSEKSIKENFKIETKIQKPITPVTESTPQLSVQSEPTANTATDTSNEATQIEENQNITTQTVTPPPPHDNPPTDDSNEKSKRKGIPAWLWFILGILFALLVVFILRFCKNEPRQVTDNENTDLHDETPIEEILPENPTIIPPVDTAKLVVDPEDPGQRKIFSDKVNIAVAKGVKLEDFARSLHEAYKENLKIVYYDTAINLLQVQTPEGEYKQWIDTLKKFTNVKLAFSNTLFEQSKKPSQDPAFSDPKKSWYFNEVQAYDAWDITQGDSSVIVAIADNGFDLNHKELKGKIVNPYNVTNGEHSVKVINSEGNEHGTHVAGTAVGNVDNNVGLCGIAPNCKLMPIQVADDQGCMQSIGIVAGILYAIHHDASVVNLSLGTYFDENVTSLPESQQQELIDNYYKDENDFWNELFEFALEENCVLVLAAGNQNILTGIDPFARSNKALIVAAYSNGPKPKADFSNYGSYSNISAPGVKIYSSVPGNKYEYLDGTSMASPIVTGAVALMKSKYPNLKAADIISILRQTAKPVQSKREIGPLLQIAQALKYAGGNNLLNIPDDAKDASFAEGKWKSTTELVSGDDSNIGVEIIFNIKNNGSTVTYKESNGYEYVAPLEVTFQNGKLVMKQSQEAVCNKTETTYDQCLYTCEQNAESGAADCLAQWDSDTENTDFHMIKID